MADFDNGLYPNEDMTDARISDISVSKAEFIEETERKEVKDISFNKSDFEVTSQITDIPAIAFDNSDFEVTSQINEVSNVCYSKDRKGKDVVMFL